MLRNTLKPMIQATVLGLILAGSGISFTEAASHREAPLIALDPEADITDVYAFRSWEDPDKVVFILNVIPGQEPSSGPNYFNFDDNVAYDINVDVNQDGKADDVVYRVRFKTAIRAPFNDLPVAYAGVDGVPGLPPIRDLTGPDAAGLGLRQRYTVTEIRNGKGRDLGSGPMFAVPSNIGPRTIPDYESLSAKGIYPLTNGGRVFTGQRDETFYIDLGATFDTLNFRPPGPILADPDDGNDGANPFGNDMFSGFNINTIALEVPISELVPKGSNGIIGMYASTSRRATEIHRPDGRVTAKGDFVQVARMANPLVNELIIGTGMKDRWNAEDPKGEKQFRDFYLNPRLVAVINLAFGTDFPISGRTDLVAALLKYPGQDPNFCNRANRCSELLRLIPWQLRACPRLRSAWGAWSAMWRASRMAAVRMTM